MRLFEVKSVAKNIKTKYLKITDFRIFYPSNAYSLIREGALWRVENSIIQFIRVLTFTKIMKSIFHNHRSPGGDPQPNQISRNGQMGQLRLLHSLAYDIFL